MFVKSIEVHVKPGQMADYLASQEIWNRETRRAPGSLGFFWGRSAKDENIVHLLFYWRSLQDYERWMQTDHDRIAQLATADVHYERLVIRLLEPIDPTSNLLPNGFLPEATLEAADVQLWSEAYRASVVVRIAVRLRLFNYLTEQSRTVADIAADLQTEPDILERLLQALGAMELVTQDAEGWKNTGLASRTLVEGADAYQGDIILHNTRPRIVEHWMKLGEKLGLPPDTPVASSVSEHEQFVRAMSDTARAGQAAALLSAVDLAGSKNLLDIGGASGAYTVALCRAYPQLRAIILDLPSTEPLAHEEIEVAGLVGRVSFRAHDYRAGEFPKPCDVILLSNILRGETPDMVADILRRAYDALETGGLVIIHDLFTEPPPAPTGLRAAFFGLHLTSGANLSLNRMASATMQAGFALERVQRLAQAVVMNGVVVGRRASSVGRALHASKPRR